MARKGAGLGKITTKAIAAPAKAQKAGALAQASTVDKNKLNRVLYGQVVPSAVYAEAMTPLVSEKNQDAVCDYAQDVMKRMAPRDPAEEMLVAQLLLTNARVMRLSELANKQTNIDSLRVIHEYADRASNTYRRLMLTLAEYRRPPRSGDTFAVVKQANIAGQQVVQNHENFPRNATNEQGFTANAGTASLPPPVSTDGGGISGVAVVGKPREAVGTVHRPANTGG